jgi:hypothetical protein
MSRFQDVYGDGFGKLREIEHRVSICLDSVLQVGFTSIRVVLIGPRELPIVSSRFLTFNMLYELIIAYSERI